MRLAAELFIGSAVGIALLLLLWNDSRPLFTAMLVVLVVGVMFALFCRRRTRAVSSWFDEHGLVAALLLLVIALVVEVAT